MGSNNSKHPRKLNIKKRKMNLTSTERENKGQLRMFKDMGHSRVDSAVSGVDVDTNPMVIDGIVMIELLSQGILLEFEMTTSGTLSSFTLIDVRHKSDYQFIVDLKSEQILIPLCRAAGIPVADSILHLKHDDAFHLRILKRHLFKNWFIIGGKLNVWNDKELNEGWSIDVTDHHTWSTDGGMD